ncbi:Domain of unknown function (DUF4304) [Anoxybacillus suryakundensis]|uniref:DUF4304 domain-containing protein n=2 Tax=Bacillales TaxID=1385 RepID=A0A0K6GQ18_9BACL|nr:DUF4304 domain-containing protein [Geobacillus sp. Manikaran-105]QCK82335.1 DUF4304 domain-containing protein [Geobacillus kaustophilus NBRC 102445]CUA80830.1 Domain of unknown function (DUF4304) [Anoxybacillus suryakundensis]
MENSLACLLRGDRMDKSEFVKYLDELFKAHSFKKKGTQWSFSNDEIIKIIKLSKSNYGNYYHIDYGFIIKNLELGRLVMHIYHRLSSLDQGESIRIKELLDFEIPIPDEDRKNELKKFIEREIFGMFNKIHTEEDLLMELKKRDHLNDIPLRVKKYFGLEDADEC